MNLNNAVFVKSAADEKGILKDTLPQIVFSGKSNVGKSSVINRLLGRKQLAKVSSVPGKTIHINYFLIDKRAYLVDLPGYGYAKVAKSEQARWSRLMDAFFSEPDHITLGIMIVDARHKPTANDEIMAQWFKESSCPLVVLANKIDKVKASDREENIAVIRETLNLPTDTQVIEFSALKGTGKDALLKKVLCCTGE